MRRFEKSEKQRIGHENRWCKMNMSLNSYAKILDIDIIEEKYLLSN